jgi:sarcosine oxidase subunit alpha
MASTPVIGTPLSSNGAGISVRVLPVGFVGALGYEIHCLSGFGAEMWDRLIDAGKAFGIKSFGVEAQRVLRLEKGHIIIGQDTDGLTHPAEADMARALSKTKPSYLGKRSVDMQIAKGVKRKLVWLHSRRCGLAQSKGKSPGNPGRQYHWARHLGGTVAHAQQIIGLAYLPTDLARPIHRFSIRVDGGRMVEAEVVATPFYDPQNKRQDM